MSVCSAASAQRPLTAQPATPHKLTCDDSLPVFEAHQATESAHLGSAMLHSVKGRMQTACLPSLVVM